jgi:ABC-type branched-subunit amino acid transport system substrate-binding protein
MSRPLFRSRASSARLAAGLLALSLAVTACGKKGGSEDEGDSGDLKTGVGVTDKEIALGVLGDLSGVYKALGNGVVQGHQIWVDEFNAAGGVCDRTVKLETRDHGYKADTAKIQFPEVEPKVLGFMQVLGSPVNAALKQDIIEKKTTAVALSWSSEILDNPYVIIPGTTYDIEMINGLSYLMDEKLLKDGDEYGANGLRGAKYFAEKHNLKIKEAKVTSTDQDMANIVTGFKGAGVKAIALTTSPAQTGSAAGANASLNLNVPLVGNNPVFSPQLLDTPAADALKKLYVVASSVPFGSDVPKAKDVAKAYKDRFKELPNAGVPYGYAIGEIWGQILEAACESGDLTREGVSAAFEELTDVTTENLVADLDFSQQGTPATREVYVAVPDKSIEGGLRQVKELFVSDDAEAYVAPHQKGGSAAEDDDATPSPSSSPASGSASEESTSSPSPSATSSSSSSSGSGSGSAEASSSPSPTS